MLPLKEFFNGAQEAVVADPGEGPRGPRPYLYNSEGLPFMALSIYLIYLILSKMFSLTLLGIFLSVIFYYFSLF